MDNLREDLVGFHLEATFKVVGAGEIRTRLRPAKHLDMKTKAIHATKAREFAWQGNFHCHQLQQERYVVVSGVLAAVWLDDGEVSGAIYREGDSFMFEPGVWHDVLTGSEAEFVTIQIHYSAEGGDSESDRHVLKDVPESVTAVMQQLYETMNRL